MVNTSNLALKHDNGLGLPTDARPMLRRSLNNIWEQAELLRDELANVLERQCAAIGIEALVLQSDLYVHPAWVKFECWIPRTDVTLTARSSMTVTISVVPCHRFEKVYKVAWEKHGRTGAIDQLHTFGEREIRALLEYLRADPRGVMDGLGRDEGHRILRPLQLRQSWFHFWKPVNKIDALRRDRLLIGSLAAAALGGVLLAGSSGGAASIFGAAATAPRAVAAIGFLTVPVFARASQDQQSAREETRGTSAIAAGIETAGSLGRTDAVREGGRRYDDWTYRVQAGEWLAVTMRSEQFDSYLIAGYMEGGRFVPVGSNDDSDGERHSRLELAAPATREYVIRATTYDADAVGPYTLKVETGAVASPRHNPALSAFDGGTAAESSGDFLLGLLFLGAGGLGLVVCARAPRTIRSAGKPMAEPRILYSLDSWQTVIFGAGEHTRLILDRILAHFGSAEQTRFAFASERVWYWGLDGKTEREHMVLRYGRALVFCQVHRYGSDLYVGWTAQMNLGTWREKRLSSGVDTETGERVRLMTVEHAVQPTNDFDLTDLNCLTEWSHAQLTSVLRQYLKERQIDQEVDFSIIRGERKGLTNEETKNTKRHRFERKA